MDSLALCEGNDGADVPTAGGSKRQRSPRLAVSQPVSLEDWISIFLDVCEEEPAAPVPRKAPGKSKRGSAADAGLAKKPRQGSSAGPVVSQPDPVLAALVGLQGTLALVDARLQHLEGTRALVGAPTSPPVVRLTPQEIRPCYTLASAVPVVASGPSLLPPMAALLDDLPDHILAGKDVNLVKIQLCGPESLGGR